MKFNTNFSRLRELFFKEVFEEEHVEKLLLEIFFKNAILHVHNKFKDIKNTKLLTVFYGEKNFYIRFKIFKYDYCLQLKSIDIGGKIKDLNIIDKFWGDITLEFSDLNISDIPRPTRDTILESKQYSYVLPKFINFSYAGDDTIKKISLMSDEKRKKVKASYKKYLNEDISLKKTFSLKDYIFLNQAFYNFLNKAERITIKNPFYENEDINQCLLMENCVIYNNLYAIYNLSSPIDTRELSYESFERAEHIFEYFSENFNSETVQWISIK